MAHARTAARPRALVAPAIRREFPRDLSRILATVSAAVSAAFAVIDEATEQSAAARRRYPSAD
jgi:hypothetical protein